MSEINSITTKGTAGQENISLTQSQHLRIPLPPLSEQRRIVAEIERWFGVIDQLESNEADLKKSIEQTKKKVLDLAIRGKLVKQEAGDEPASELLKRIKENVETHGRASKGKKTAIPSVELDEVPFEVPEGWEWCRLLDIAEQVGSKENQILAKEVLGEGLVPVVSQSSILIDGYSDETDRKMTDLPVILFGDHTRVVKYIDFEFVVGADGTKLLKPLINSKYLYYWTICAADSIRNRGYARHFALLKEVPFPLPPLEEQRRIVERVEEVMGVLERIEKMIKS